VSDSNITRHFEAGLPPEKPGLYVIKLNPDTVRRIVRRYADGELDWNAAQRLLEPFFINPFQRAYNGELKECDKSVNLSKLLALKATSGSPDMSVIGNCSTTQLRTLSDWSQLWAGLLPPIYVGVTETQTLRERIEQHRSNMEDTYTEANTFGYRARKAGLAWEDLIVGWIAADDRRELEALRSLEKTLHIFLRPTLSNQ